MDDVSLLMECVMHATFSGERTLTDLDFSRLTKLQNGQLSAPLADLLASAEVLSSRAVDDSVVTMHSQFEMLDLVTHCRRTLTLCYPDNIEPSAGFISVLSPVGLSVLGLRVGEVARWLAPNGEDCAARVERILSHPDGTGDYNT